MKYEVTAEYTEQLVKTATRRFLSKLLGWEYSMLWAAMLAVFIALGYRGGHAWPMGACGSIAAILPLLYVLVHHAYSRRAIIAFRKRENPQTTFSFDDEGIGASSELATGHVKWPAVEKLWCFPEAWLVFLGKNSYWTLPTTCLTDDIKQFITNKLKEHGKVVR